MQGRSECRKPEVNDFEAARRRALWLTGRPVTPPQRLCSVLLVDESPLHQIPLLRALRARGHRVLLAADGASAESLCWASPIEIDALVACADMQRMCGFELARRIARVHPDVRVLLMWRHVEEIEEAQHAVERGYAVIEEPFTPEELCSRLTKLLASPRNDTRAEPSPTLQTALARARAKASSAAPKSRARRPSKEVHPWNRAKLVMSPPIRRRCAKTFPRS